MRHIYLLGIGVYAGLTTYALGMAVKTSSFEYVFYGAVLMVCTTIMRSQYYTERSKAFMNKLFGRTAAARKNKEDGDE